MANFTGKDLIKGAGVSTLTPAQNFIHEDFLLNNTTAVRLYHEVAANLPIIDYHNHLNPRQLAVNYCSENIGQLWVTSDPYKHRAMRICGVPEHFITGQATDKEKFEKWAAILPQTLGNPLFHWSALELKNLFGIEEFLTTNTAESIWETCNYQLAGGGFGMLDILQKFNTELTCTSDDLLDDLTFHEQATALATDTTILPSLRADSILSVNSPAFSGWLKKLSELTSLSIRDLNDYKAAIILRLNYFAAAGCALSDHALDDGFYFQNIDFDKANILFKQVLQSNNLVAAEVMALQSYLLVLLGGEYRQRGWVLQLHVGALRATSSRLRQQVGPAGGYAGIGKPFDVASISRFLDALDQNNQLPKTILYPLNPTDNEALATLTGSFSEDGVPGKIQFGPAWWYNDHLTGIENHLLAVASYSLLSQFIGMTTDSRSVLSFTRHEYFRRICCNVIGQWVEAGKLPNDPFILYELVEKICYQNAKNWFIKNNND